MEYLLGAATFAEWRRKAICTETTSALSYEQISEWGAAEQAVSITFSSPWRSRRNSYEISTRQILIPSTVRGSARESAFKFGDRGKR